MLKSDIRHQLWLTKKTFQRKLGGKEDDCVIASDSELDAKIELFKFIQSEGNALYRISDQYQERICILAQEENSLGKFLKENGKNSLTTDKVMINCGRAISYCGQMRFLIRPPLLRFFNELEVFRRRAVTDTQNTIMLMEKQRTEYRASLSWMKSMSNVLDPDSDRMLEKFRNAQNRVRQTKDKFDKYSLDCLQKIDLLAASRCNLFSHSLIAYMENLTQFFAKSIDTLKILSSTLNLESHYDFTLLKSISEGKKTEESVIKSENGTINKPLAEICIDNKTGVIDSEQHHLKIKEDKHAMVDLVDIFPENVITETKKPENQSLLDTIFDNPDDFLTGTMLIDITKNDNINFTAESQNFLNFNSIKPEPNKLNDHENQNSNNTKSHSWFDLFSELDPFADPDAMTKQYGGKVADTQAA